MSAWNKGAEAYAGAFALFTQYFAAQAAAKLAARVAAARGAGPVAAMDAAAGTGASTLALRDALAARGVRGAVLATDMSDGMLGALEAKLAKEGPSPLPVTTQVMDLGTLEQQDDASLDALFCVFGIMFVDGGSDAGAKRAAAAIHRVLKPGGVACVVTWADLSHNEHLANGGVATGTLPEAARETFMAGLLRYGTAAYAEEFMTAGGFATGAVSMERITNEGVADGARRAPLPGLLQMLVSNPVLSAICDWDVEAMAKYLAPHCELVDGEPFMPLVGTALAITAVKEA
eukprot:TRINITY_DN22279_c0_g1_i1.p2 TRINITY_DN22279_c0_g1~~TRINITY_DN22279_c0_g1_i1.p2  ORF type:complete len:289 (+),score=118.29 TRINITY_DN22279_c0_g1_i1:54-920(+)